MNPNECYNECDGHCYNFSNDTDHQEIDKEKARLKVRGNGIVIFRHSTLTVVDVIYIYIYIQENVNEKLFLQVFQHI